MSDWIVVSLIGAVLISVACIAFLALSGRVLGVSGIVFGLLPPRGRDSGWRLAFLAGLIGGGLLARAVLPGAMDFTVLRSSTALAIAGLLVGFGARLGSGCTSGHGICGIGRLSSRSLVATLTFITAGAATVFMTRHVLGG